MHTPSPPASPAVETEPLSRRVGAEILAELARRRLTRSDLAALLGVPTHVIADRLAGRARINLDDLQKIADALELEPTVLLERATA